MKYRRFKITLNMVVDVPVKRYTEAKAEIDKAVKDFKNTKEPLFGVPSKPVSSELTYDDSEIVE